VAHPPHLLANVQKGGEWYIVGRGSVLMVYGMCCCCCLLYVLQAGLSQSKFWTSSKRGRLSTGLEQNIALV